MKFEALHIWFAAILVFFGVAVPFIIHLAADFLKVPELTPWRCVKAGIAGLVGLVFALRIGTELHSFATGAALLAAMWAAAIHFFLKTTLARALGVWVVTQGFVLLVAFTTNQFTDLEARVVQLFGTG